MGIHYIDLFRSLFGRVRTATATEINASGAGTATDTVRCSLTFEQGCMSTITASYATPFQNVARIVGTDGILEKLGDRVVLRGPRDSFDAQGRFAEPPVLETFESPQGGIHADSLRKSVAHIIERAKAGIPLDTEDFRASLETMELMFRIEEASRDRRPGSDPPPGV